MLYGIDISSYQPSDYDTDDLEFVFIKITEGLSYVNPKWVAQRATARSAGLVTGFYHYPHIDNDPVEEAEFFLDQINLVPGDIIVLDWEWYGQDVSDDRARAYRAAWLTHVKAKAPDHRVGIYSDRNNWRTVDTDSTVGDFLWIADYVRAGAPRIDYGWTFHQYTDEPLDRNVADFPDGGALRRWAGASGDDVYEPFPGEAFFRSAPTSPIITAMGRRLVAEGCSVYRQGPSPQWTGADRASFALWQKKLGDAPEFRDGWPGPRQWAALKVPRS
ncbi:GH25 family lysozyme [Streptomyces sp. NPDC020667]|uniref:GH25 family lysozyme n=1 Tax=Streptomyces sp. NPDC020667 TaxID=3154895 RepID=UPI0033EA0108